MSNDCVAVHIIQRARKNKQANCLGVKELEFVLNHQDLFQIDKLLWTKIACLSANEPSLMCTIELRPVADTFNTTKLEIFESLLRLKQRGFLEVGFNVHLSQFTQIQSLSEINERVRPLGDFKLQDNLEIDQINSIHCGLLLPINGLISLIDPPIKQNFTQEVIISKNEPICNTEKLNFKAYLRKLL